jgi:CBS-domain-containing membrane protein
MLVENWMSKDVVTVDVNDSMQYATRLLKEHKISGKREACGGCNGQGP